VTLFSLDTSTRTGSLAIWRDGTSTGRAGDDPRSHAERLPREAVDWLAEQGATLADVDVFVIVAGPGSFTGLRVGVSAVQGWAFATGKPVAAVQTLDAVVASVSDADRNGRILVPCMDALRGEVFFGAWRGDTELIDARVGRRDEVIAAVREAAAGAEIAMTGDGAEKYGGAWTEAGWRAVSPAMTLAEAAARLVADRRVTAGPPHAARLHYVRKSDAELVRERGGRRA
jgi:tRNA threonylcarbamoyladenosine biosynthesis protein TsaB